MNHQHRKTNIQTTKPDLDMKKLKTYIMTFLMLFLAAFHVQAQVAVSGKITDGNQEGLIGVTIMVKGTSIGTITDTDGNYSLNVPNENSTLTVSYVGFLTQEVPVANQSVIDVAMELDVAQLDEVVVTGYGSQRKRDITGAVAVVDVEEMNKSQFVNITDRLQGRVAGVTVTNNGEPGSRGDIKIRGTAFFGDNNPLFVIDGVLTDDSPNLNPNDVESIQVLKDASSAAIYGSRAANGVVVITTKKGRRGKPEINVSAMTGFQQVSNKLDMMNAEEWARVANAAADNEGAERQAAADNLTGIDTDWQDEVFNDAALIQDLNMSISGGSQNSRVYFSLNNTYQEGTIKGPLFERLSARLNSEFNLLDNLTIGENLTVANARSSGEQEFLGVDFDGVQVIGSAIGMLPVIPVLDPTKTNGYGHGVPSEASTFTPNPVAVRDLFKNSGSSTRLLGNVFTSYRPIEGLEYRLSVGVDANFERSKNYWKGGQIRMTTVHRSGLAESRSESVELFLENRLTYTKSIGDHSFSAMATYMEQSIRGAGQSVSITGGYDQQDPFFQISSTTAPANAISSSGDEFESAIKSYLGRLTYNYADRYLLTVNVRHDGSSKFSEDNRWGTFPSASVGWNLTNESFFNVEQISNLKIRAGYGQVGNASIGDYLYQSLINSAAAGGVNYNFGPGSTSVIGATRGGIVNSDIKWEVLKETNIGIDLAMFDGRLEFIGDYYFGNLEDLLAEVSIPLTVAPGGGSPTINAVSMVRNGWEAAVTYRKFEGEFQWSVSANAFNTRNEITALPFGVNEFFGDNSISRKGLPLGQLFLPTYRGIYDENDIAALDPEFTINGVAPGVGDANYIDNDSRDPETGQLTGEPDGQISFDDDRSIVGDPNPAVQYGLNFEGYYKGFDMTIFWQGVSARDVFNSWYAGLNSNPGENYTADFDPFIEGQGKDPRPFISEEGGNEFPSTRFVENGAFLRLKNLQIGYTIPWNKVKNFRVYVSGQNLLTFTEYRGLDPEFEGGVFEPGVDPQGFPNLRIYSLGFNVLF